jgi:hypothetical protein
MFIVFIFLTCQHKSSKERRIRTSDLCFIRRGPQPIELSLGDFSYVFLIALIKKHVILTSLNNTCHSYIILICELYEIFYKLKISVLPKYSPILFFGHRLLPTINPEIGQSIFSPKTATFIYIGLCALWINDDEVVPT